ncbi:MAG: hypothetical protein ACM3UY_05310 [Methanocella sp.]
MEEPQIPSETRTHSNAHSHGRRAAAIDSVKKSVENPPLSRYTAHIHFS